MKITESKVTKIKIEDILKSHRLDPITVFLEDLEPRKGKITIECFGKSWTAFWGGMGDRTISQFFCSCDDQYLIENLSGPSKYVFDEEDFRKKTKLELIRLRKEDELPEDRAREIWDHMDDICDDELEQWYLSIDEMICDVWGNDCLYEQNFKTAINHEYEYLCRIINTVKEALKQEK